MVPFFLLFGFFVTICHSCPSGTIQGLTANDCYYFSTNAMDWADAEFFCTNMNGHLTTIANVFENNFLQQKAQTTFPANTIAYYIGGTNAILGSLDKNNITQFSWAWADGTPFSYSNWVPLQLLPTKGVSYQNLSSGQWFADNCDPTDPEDCATKYFVCKVPNGDPHCIQGGNDVVYYDSTKQCYTITQGDFLQDHLKYCSTLGITGARLASIHNVAQNTAIATFAQFYASEMVQLLGLSNNNVSWVWMDNSRMDYMNWEPQKPTQTDFCGAMLSTHNLTWTTMDETGCNLLAFTDEIAGICQWDTTLTRINDISEIKVSHKKPKQMKKKSKN